MSGGNNGNGQKKNNYSVNSLNNRYCSLVSTMLHGTKESQKNVHPMQLYGLQTTVTKTVRVQLPK